MISRDLGVAVEDSFTHGRVGGADDLALAQAAQIVAQALEGLGRELELAQTSFEDRHPLVRRGQAVLDHFVETARQGMVKDFDMVGSGHDDAVGAVGLFHEGEHRIEDSAHLAHIVRIAAARANGVELVEQVDATHAGDLVEH
ncbi:hypothetical protein D3C86_1726110 [compost metagenome]